MANTSSLNRITASAPNNRHPGAATCKCRLAGLLICFVTLLGCHRTNTYASVLDVADSGTAGQLLYGFYPVENGAWRWTGKRFAIFLRNPNSDEAPETILRVAMFIPDSQVQALGPVTLHILLDCAELPPRTLSAGGSYELKEVIPPSELKTNLVPIYFWLDKAAPPTFHESRELGAIFSSFGLYTTERLALDRTQL